MLGADLCRIFRERGHTVEATDIAELDVRDAGLVARTIAQARPDGVLHLAALTDVDACERAPDEAYRTNALGTQHVALACRQSGATLVYISTISVFDGASCRPYTEFDAPNPQSAYSRAKYAGERMVERLTPQHYIVRAGWMFGGGPLDKKFVAKIIELARARATLSVVDDKFGSPTYTCDLAAGIERLLHTGLYGLYHMVNPGDVCSRHAFAQAILATAGITTCQLLPVSSAAFPLPAPRPAMEAARNYQLELHGWDWMRPWRAALAEYVRTTLDLTPPAPPLLAGKGGSETPPPSQGGGRGVGAVTREAAHG
jgi:dTDP-4-dehydrorhamnose reductase